MSLNDLLKITFERRASDLHLKVGVPPILRIDGRLVPLEAEKRLTQEDALTIAFGIMNNTQKTKFKEKNELDLAYGVPGLGRFRVNVFQQRGSVGMVFRSVPSKILNFEELMLPAVLTKIAQEQRGMILVTGTTGSGKSTTLAAMIDHINATRTANIVTIEDPIEFLHRDKKSIVNQREIGSDTFNFSDALRSALRQDPDVILVGEMRDFEVMLGTLTVREAIIDQDKTRQIPGIIASGLVHYGMQTFDQSLLMLYKKGIITYDEALLTASNPDDFVLKVKGVQSTSDLTWEADEKARRGQRSSPASAPKEGEAKEYKPPASGS